MIALATVVAICAFPLIFPSEHAASSHFRSPDVNRGYVTGRILQKFLSLPHDEAGRQFGQILVFIA